MITQKRLKEVLHYCPETGKFTWVVSRGSKCMGSEAGSVDGRGYSHISVGGQRVLAHRLAWLYMTGTLPANQLHHKNRNRLDNSWTNLELTTPSKNNIARGVQRNNVSGLVGLSWAAHCSKWKVSVQSELGHYQEYFSDKVEAIAHLLRARRSLQGADQ